MIIIYIYSLLIYVSTKTVLQYQITPKMLSKCKLIMVNEDKKH